jgi:uncharacterized protein (TIGR02594 family)
MSKLLEIALSQYGQKEIAGTEHNPVIVNYAKEAGHTWVNDDETPGCSIFIDWCAMKAGVERTRKANALSWLSVGVLTTEPKTGDVVVFKRGNNPNAGHVGIYIAAADTGYLYVLGANQSDQVKISIFNEDDVLGYIQLREVPVK